MWMLVALAVVNGANGENKPVQGHDEVYYDSTRVEQLAEVVVKGVKAQQNAPFAVTNIKKKELQEFSKTGRELPFLFAQTPGVLAWSTNGMGIGTAYMRIRGAGDSRINVTIDGVPLNSPEDQCVFWANMNSYAALLGSVQVQRGVGTSTNGDGAFGGTVVLSTKTPSDKPSLELSGAYGSYATFNVGGSFSSGLLYDHLIIDGAYHETNTHGYVNGTAGRSGSYTGGLTWTEDNFIIRFRNIGNFETTGQAWNGVTAGDNNLSLMDGTYGANTGITTYKDMYNAGLGKYNSLYERMATDANGKFVKDAEGRYLTQRYTMADGSLWEKATDNFWQNHSLLSLVYDWGGHWTATGTLRYTYGYGYYNEFRYNNKLSKFGLSNFITSQGNTVKRSDFVRKKGLSQNALGVLGNVNYKNNRWDVIGGASLQGFNAEHFGYITYVSEAELSSHLLARGDYRYYASDADKLDGSFFLKAAYRIAPAWDVFADMQYRHVSYKTGGYNDKFIDNNDGTYSKHILDINKKYDFFNPKAGISFRQDGHRAFASVAMSHREPERNNFTDNGNYPAPKAERLLDYEAGYSYTGSNWHAGIGMYYMDYTDQFVQTGALSNIGEPLTTNVKDSYRMGIELTAGWAPATWLTLEGNAALSENKIKDFDEVASVNWEDDFRTIHYDNSTLAFSPSTILNGFVDLHWKGMQAVWHTNFVSSQYLDNTENSSRALPCYSVTNVNLSYTLPCKRALGLKEIVLGTQLSNIFNRRYAASGWVYSSIVEGYGHANDNRYYQIGFVPMAGFTAMGSVTLRF